MSQISWAPLVKISFLTKHRNVPTFSSECENSFVVSNSAHTSFCTAKLERSTAGTRRKNIFWLEGDVLKWFIHRVCRIQTHEWRSHTWKLHSGALLSDKRCWWPTGCPIKSSLKAKFVHFATFWGTDLMSALFLHGIREQIKKGRYSYLLGERHNLWVSECRRSIQLWREEASAKAYWVMLDVVQGC